MIIKATNGYDIEIDDADYDLVKDHSWHVRKMAGSTKYVAATTLYMHRVVTRVEPGKVVDHRDNDGLNNTQDNLRVCLGKQNATHRVMNKNNKLGLKGVYRLPRSKRYFAKIRAYNVTYHLGTFDTPKEAHAAYVAAAMEKFGEFFDYQKSFNELADPETIAPDPALAKAALD